MSYKDRQEQEENSVLIRIICCIALILSFIISIGFFGLILNKSCVFIKEQPTKQRSVTPVMDKVHADVEKALKERK